MCIDKTNDWISVSDELPNYDFDVIVCDKHGNVCAAYLSDLDEEFHDTSYIVKDVYLWMPLPIGRVRVDK